MLGRRKSYLSSFKTGFTKGRTKFDSHGWKGNLKGGGYRSSSLGNLKWNTSKGKNKTNNSSSAKHQRKSRSNYNSRRNSQAKGIPNSYLDKGLELNINT